MNAAIKESAIRVDILVIGGGTAGSVAAIKAKEGLPDGEVLLLEKANVKRSGAIALGMDGVNNAVVPGHATPEQYVKEITMANDGIVNQRAVLAYARESFGMIQGTGVLGSQISEDAVGRLRRQESAPQGQLCAADAGGIRHQEDPYTRDPANRA